MPRITGLPVASNVGIADLLVIVQANITKRAAVSLITANGNLDHNVGNLTVNGILTVIGNSNLAANANVGGNLIVVGTANLSGNATVGNNLTVGGNQNVGGSIIVSGNGTVTGNVTIAGALTANGNVTLGNNAADALLMTTNAMVVTAAGEVTFPLQPAFLASKSATSTNVTGAATNADYICDSEIIDRNADYNNATGVFTAPVTGMYALGTHCLVQDITAAMTQQNLELVTSNRTYPQQTITIPAGTQIQYTLEQLADMDAGDTAFPRVRLANGVGDTADVFGSASTYTNFYGNLAC